MSTIADKISDFLGTASGDAIALSAVDGATNSLTIYGNDSGLEAFMAWVDANEEASAVQSADTSNKELYDGYAFQIVSTDVATTLQCIFTVLEEGVECADAPQGCGGFCWENDATADTGSKTWAGNKALQDLAVAVVDDTTAGDL